VIPCAKNPILEVGYNIPVEVGLDENAIATPRLVIDLDAFERNVAKMKSLCLQLNIQLRPHGKLHKSGVLLQF
jgi:3-hydroxy-D-aspartate aldolase